MFLIELIALFILGAVLASFIGVVAGRLYTGQSIARGYSRCDACGSRLEPLVLVPIVSYLASSGRAHCCQARLSPLSPVSELSLGALFVLSYLHLGLTFALAVFLVALTLLVALVLYDLAHQILPPELLTLFVVASACQALLSAPVLVDIYPILVWASVFALFLATLHGASRGRAMGLADAPLAAGLALLVGHAALPGFLFSFWIGAGVGIVLLAMAPRGSRMGIEVPFAPFLAAGFLLAYFTQWDPLALTTTLTNLLM